MVAEHAITGHDVNWSAKIIERASKTRVRWIKETLSKHGRDKNGKTTLNRDQGVDPNAMWLDLMQ